MSDFTNYRTYWHTKTGATPSGRINRGSIGISNESGGKDILVAVKTANQTPSLEDRELVAIIKEDFAIWVDPKSEKALDELYAQVDILERQIRKNTLWLPLGVIGALAVGFFVAWTIFG